MQIGYVGVGVRRASLFVRSPAFGPPSHCFGSVALVTRWAAEGETKDTVQEVGSKATEDLQALFQSLGPCKCG